MLATFQIPMERRNTMQVENKTSSKYSSKKNAKSCSLRLEAHLLKEVGSSLSLGLDQVGRYFL